MLESQIQIHPIIGYGTNTNFVEKFNLAAREVQFIWHELPGASAIGIKRHIQDYSNGHNPEYLMKGSSSCLCSTTLNGQKQYRTMIMPKKWAAFATKFKQRTFVLRPASENMWWNAHSNESRGQRDIVALQMVDIVRCRASHPIFPATDPLSLGHLKKGRIGYHFTMYIPQQDSSRPSWQAIYCVFTVEVASGMRL